MYSTGLGVSKCSNCPSCPPASCSANRPGSANRYLALRCVPLRKMSWLELASKPAKSKLMRRAIPVIIKQRLRSSPRPGTRRGYWSGFSDARMPCAVARCTSFCATRRASFWASVSTTSAEIFFALDPMFLTCKCKNPRNNHVAATVSQQSSYRKRIAASVFRCNMFSRPIALSS
jgi:hypothetical protein